MLSHIVNCLLVIVFVQVHTGVVERSCKTSCSNPCKYGHNGRGFSGCMDCRCKQNPHGCPNSLTCRGRAPCWYGMALNDKGCYTCDCAPNPDAGACTRPCTNTCPFGYINPTTGYFGCVDCRCKQNPNGCPNSLTCTGAGSCKYGDILDENGCKTCSCRSDLNDRLWTNGTSTSRFGQVANNRQPVSDAKLTALLKQLQSQGKLTFTVHRK